MRCLLIQHGWEAALDPFPGTMTDADKTATLKTDVYKKAHSALLLCLDNKVLREVNKEDSAAGVWLKLETLYMTKSLANKLYLKKKLFTFYMDSGKKLSEHIDEFNKSIGELANIDVDIDDEDQALMLLTSLPSSYDNFVETLLYGRESLTLEDVLSSLNLRELKKRTNAKDDGDGLYVRGRSAHRGNQGRGSSRSKSKGKGTYKVKCYICYSEDHLKKDYPKRNKKKSTGFVKKNAGQGSGMHSEGYDNGDLLMAVSEERFLEWIMDSGGSFHMTPRKDFLFDFKEFNGGIGKVRVQMKDGSSFVLENVRYIPELKRNLISLGTLDREGYTVKLQNGRVKVIKGSLMVLSGTMKGNCVYSLDGWAESVLHELEKREVLGNKGLGKLEFCENYVLGKSTRGPSRVESMSGCRYFLSIVDDYSRRVWVHFLRHKNEAFSKFKEWKQLVENQTGRKLKKLRTDNGLEFYNQEFNSLCKESGITRHLTVAGTPQQNGLAERMNRTLLNKVRCLLIQSGLPDSFWAEATVTAAYLINRSPSTTLEKKTPMDLWSGHPANYEMLRIFGCVAYSHVNQGKLKPRAIKCIFLGYPDGVKGYILWRLDDVKPKIIISRDVVFNESLMYKDTLKGAGAADSGKEVEFEVELQGSRVEPTMYPHTGENPGNEDEGPQQQNLENYVLVRDRAKRTTAIPARYKDEGNVSLSRPSGSKEAINSFEKDEWVRAMEEEMNSLKKNHTWELVDQPPGQKLLEQLDVKTAFLHGNLEETIYMRQPPGFEEGTGNTVCLLKKSLHGLKLRLNIPRDYYEKEFDMKELGLARKILGMEIVRDRGSQTLKVSQPGYVQKILNNYRVDNGKSASMPLGAHFKVYLKDCPSSEWNVERMSKVPYANTVGSLMYLMVCTRPDIGYVVSIVSRYLANPGLVYGRDQGKHVDFDGFVDADYAKDPDKGRSSTEYVFMVHGCVVSWKATLQHVVTLSTTEAEYIALIEAVKESIWLKCLLIELGVNLRSMVMNCDNQSAIHLSRNAMFHERTKHINVRYHFIREIVKSKEIEVAKIGAKDNAADAFTKVVPGPKFKYFMEILGVGIN
ncbi:zinc finger, CCHC-type containing protein [Tanacetum coccineum]